MQTFSQRVSLLTWSKWTGGFVLLAVLPILLSSAKDQVVEGEPQLLSPAIIASARLMPQPEPEIEGQKFSARASWDHGQLPLNALADPRLPAMGIARSPEDKTAPRELIGTSAPAIAFLRLPPVR